MGLANEVEDGKILTGRSQRGYTFKLVSMAVCFHSASAIVALILS